MQVKIRINKNAVIITVFTGKKKYQGKLEKSEFDEMASSAVVTDRSFSKIKDVRIESAVVSYKTDGRLAKNKLLVKALKEA